MPRARLVVAALVASLFVHLALVVFVPGLRWRLPVRDLEQIEVELTRPVPVEPPPVEPPAPPEPVAPPETPRPPAAETVETVNRILARAGGTPVLPSSPPIRLPARRPSTVEPPELSWRVPLPPGSDPIPVQPLLHDDLPPAPMSTQPGSAVEDLLAAVQAESPEPTVREESLSALDIEWEEGVTRRVLEAPPLPPVEITNEVEARIRFWVSPRGEVIRALPTRRGDAVLDRVALAYVRGLKFNDLPAGDETQQWGTIVVRFRRQ